MALPDMSPATSNDDVFSEYVDLCASAEDEPSVSHAEIDPSDAIESLRKEICLL